MHTNDLNKTHIYEPNVYKYIDHIYETYPAKCGDRHVIVWGEGDNTSFVLFELAPSLLRNDAVEIKWIESYPKCSGFGSNAMTILQQIAKKENVNLTLYPLNKGSIAQSILKTIYKSMGFLPISDNSNNMIWVP